jgi:histone-lysine N-methyltransferase SETMAR
MSRSSMKTMFIKVVNIRGTIHREFVPQDQTINTKFYCKVLRHLRENIQLKRPDLWRTKNSILHNDNAPCHRALLVREFLANHNMVSLLRPPYSPDLAPANFHFLKMKVQLIGRCFHTVAKIQCESQKVMDSNKMTLRPYSSSGKNSVICALLCKVTISKEMAFKLNVMYFFVNRASPGTF